MRRIWDGKDAVPSTILCLSGSWVKRDGPATLSTIIRINCRNDNEQESPKYTVVPVSKSRLVMRVHDRNQLHPVLRTQSSRWVLQHPSIRIDHGFLLMLTTASRGRPYIFDTIAIRQVIRKIVESMHGTTGDLKSRTEQAVIPPVVCRHRWLANGG